MSAWDGGWYPRGPKPPPPERGIKMKKAGSTWWGQRWIAALQQVLRGDEGRLARGRTYARAGRTHDLVIKGGKVTAKVTGSRPTPYAITIQLAQLDEVAWKAAIAAMAAKAQFAAGLLAGQMPQEIDEAFAEAGTSLFPAKRADLRTSCSCPDSGDPCKHVAATHYVLGEALDRDPFLLFELRGKAKEQVLDALRAARGGAAPVAAPPAAKGRARKVAPPAPVAPGDYDKPRAALPSLHFSFDEPVTHGAVLRQLGAPAAWQGQGAPADVLAPLVRAAAENARRLALSDPKPSRPPAAEPDPGSAPPAPPRPPAGRRGGAGGRRG